MVIAGCGVSPDEKSLKATATAGCGVVAAENPESGDEAFFSTDLKTRAAFLDGLEDDPEERAGIQKWDG